MSATGPARILGDVDYDVIIVGASIAGCTAATAYGRAGLRVALLERHDSAQAFKTLCGHFVLGGAHDVLQRLGFWEQMRAHGAVVTTGPGVWTEYGWVVPPAGSGVPPAISLRRVKLDPLLRRIAAGTAGVDFMPGHRVVELVEDLAGAVSGVVVTTSERPTVVPMGRRSSAEGPAGAGSTDARASTGVSSPAGPGRITLRARLVVGADGHHSTVARLAGVSEDRAPNNRFLFWTYYESAVMNGPGDAQIWRRDGDVAVCIRIDDGLTQVGVFPSKRRLPQFTADRMGAFDRFVERLPDGPSLGGAHRVSNLIGTTDYPCVRRDPTPRPGLALIGDAATASDPVPAVGCGWAFRSAAWLVDATAEALAGNGNLDHALRAYRRAHRFIDRYETLSRREALAQPPPALQRKVQAAAVSDPFIAHRLAMFAMRAAEPSVLLNPRVVLRALRAAIGGGTRRG